MILRQLAFSLVLAMLVLPSAAGENTWPILKTYEGEYLRRVKMPLGGIGTGTVSLNGRGGLVDWSIRSSPAIGFTPSSGRSEASSGFWLRTRTIDGKVATRLMEGPLDSELYEGAEGVGALNHGFPRFRSCKFRAAYPLAQVCLSDEAMPVDATLEAMNPLVPGDVEASSFPVAVLRWKLSNKTDDPVTVSILGFLVNPAAGDTEKHVVNQDGLSGVSIGSADETPSDSTRGRVALVAPFNCGAISQALHIDDLEWRVRMDRFWKQFEATGKASDLRDPDGKWELDAVAVSVTINLAARESHDIPFLLAWRFPHRAAWSGVRYRDAPVDGPFDPAREIGNYYAKCFETAEDAAVALWRSLPELESKTVAFVETVAGARAPLVVKEAALFNLSTLRTETCFRAADGHFFGWEGIFERSGSCYGNCTHVWGYEHALVELWPSLARDMLETAFGPAMDGRGHMSFRVGLPLATHARATIACADGQMQSVIKAYEYWRRSKDDAWLKKIYPKVRRAVEFCWVEGGWDADRDGVMEGCQHNTMDVEYYGPNPQMEFLYLSALKSMAAMSETCQENDFARVCRRMVEQGSVWTERNLFNGHWYEHKVVLPTGKIAEGLSSVPLVGRALPDFQLAAGCLIDQLVGDYASRHVGLGPVAEESHANKTLDTILVKCSSANIRFRYNCGRDYAMPEEPSLKMAWYPPGRMPAKPFPYYGENMTGFEYVVAANLAQRGRFEEAEAIVRNVRSRYDGRKRNPFDECECGHHYVRGLVSWSVLSAYLSAPLQL